MTATISPPVRIVAALGIAAAVGLAAFMFLLGGPAEDSATTAAPLARATTPSTPPVTRPASQAPATTAPEPPAALQSKSGLPLVVERALQNRKVAVIAVYMPGASVDAAVRKEARAGAIKAGAAYLALPATNARLLGPLVAKAGVLPSPAVVIVKRPGVVVTTFGVTDRDLVAQAAKQARR
ncbi:MAG: hypothetical protein R6W48_00495 [Gaiellaceae bacterium]